MAEEDEELLFADTRSGALRRHTRKLEQPGGDASALELRAPPEPDVAQRPHVLLSPVLSGPLLLSREQPCRIGREPEATVCIRSDTVSKHHAEIYWEGTCFVVHDLSSLNGTELGGRTLPAQRAVPLHDGDQLVLGGYDLTVKVLAPGEVPSEQLPERTRAVPARRSAARRPPRGRARRRPKRPGPPRR